MAERSFGGKRLRTVADFVRFGASRFHEAGLCFAHGTDDAVDEALALVLHALHLPADPPLPSELFHARLTPGERREVRALLRRRVEERVPAAYLIGEAWFAGLPFEIDPRVLVPRSPLAELVEGGFQPWVDGGRIRRVLDLGTGSGCIAAACAHAFPEARVDAVDVSPGAVAVARRNVARLGLGERVRVVESDLFEGLEREPRRGPDRGPERGPGRRPEREPGQGPEDGSDPRADGRPPRGASRATRPVPEGGPDTRAGGRYDLIVSNPPYVPDEEMAALPPEFRAEPAAALAGGVDGLDVVGRILEEAPGWIAPGGVLVVEVGASPAVRAALEARFPSLPFVWLQPERGGEGVFLLHEHDF